MRGFNRTFGAFAAAVLLALPVSLLFSPEAHARGAKRVTFEEYKKLDDATRRRMIRRYVKRSPRGEWEVLLRSYHIRTDISDEAALALAVKMDEFYAGFRSIFIGAFRIRVRPMLYAMKDKASYHSALSSWSSGRTSVPTWSAGCFATLDKEYALFGCSEWGEEKMYTTLFHEGTHHLLRFYIGRQFPRWFNEGVATNFQDRDVSLSAERNIYESIWKSRYPMLLHAMVTGRKLKGKKLPKPDLVKLMSSGEKEWVQSSDPSIWYAQGWGFVNFLLSSGKSGQRNVNTLITSFRKGVEFRKVAPMAIRIALARQYHEYMEEVIVPHVECSLLVARLMKAGNVQAASLVVEEGLKKHPKNFELLYYQGLLALEAGDAAGAYKILRPLEKKKPRHPLLYKTLGRAALEAGNKPKGKTWLRKALREDRGDEEARELLK